MIWELSSAFNSEYYVDKPNKTDIQNSNLEAIRDLTTEEIEELISNGVTRSSYYEIVFFLRKYDIINNRRPA
jgi:hypothetical protein